jgi:hypothetical protein
MTDEHRKWLEGAGLALLTVGFLLMITRDQDSSLWQGIQASGWLAVALGNSGQSAYGRAIRKVQFGIAALMALSITVHVLSIESPFSDATTGRIEVIAALAILVLVPGYVIREVLRPTSADFRQIEAAHKESQRRAREQSKDQQA